MLYTNAHTCGVGGYSTHYSDHEVDSLAILVIRAGHIHIQEDTMVFVPQTFPTDRAAISIPDTCRKCVATRPFAWPLLS